MFCFSLMHIRCSLLFVFGVPLLMKHVGQMTLLRYLWTSPNQIHGIQPGWPTHSLQVPRSQEVLVEYMTDRFLLELLIDTIGELREIMVSDVPLDESTNARILEEGYLTQIVIEDLLDPLAQESILSKNRCLLTLQPLTNTTYLDSDWIGGRNMTNWTASFGRCWTEPGSPRGVRMYTLRLMAQECWNNQATGAGHQIMVEPVMTAIAQQIVTTTAITQLALRGERISSEDKCQAILNEAASRKQEQEKKRKDWENLEKENLQLLREDKKDLDMMQNIAEFNVWTLRRVQWYKNNADGYINRASMEDDMDNSMTRGESRKLAVCSKKIKNKSSAPMLRHVRRLNNQADGCINRVCPLRMWNRAQA